MKQKLIRITTISVSLEKLLKGQLAFLNQYYEVVGLASGNEKLLEVEKREGIRTIEVDIVREINLIKDIKSLFSLIAVIKREKPFIVHANTPKGSLLAMVAASISHVPHRIYTVTGLRFETTKGIFRFILKTMERVTCFCATKVIPEGEGVKKLLINENITNKPLHKIFNGNINGIDLDYYSLSEEVINKANTIKDSNIYFTFCFIGRMVKDKGINELVHVFVKLHEEFPKTRLLLVGPFEKKSDPVTEDVERSILNHKGILFMDYQDDVRPFFAASDALVFPSYREGFPNVVLQAGAMGLPSIVSDINGCNEIIIEKQNGVIIHPKNEDALYNAMKNFVENKDGIVKDMANKARTMIESRYDQKKLWVEILAEYQKLE